MGVMHHARIIAHRWLRASLSPAKNAAAEERATTMAAER